MGPNKFEIDFQKKLNHRQIKPSANSWDRLDAMLTVAEEKKTKRNYDWMYIAASIIGFIFIGTLFFSQTEELIDVKRNNVVLESKAITKPLENAIKEQTKIIVSPSISPKSIAMASKDSNFKQNQVIQNPTPNTQRLTPNKIINQKAEQLNALNQNTVIVDERIAAIENLSKNEIPKSVVKVDALHLLSQIDGELELSFREKVINTIGKNYKTVKVALANRNQE
ncbi:hypothetical protein [Flavobacterium luteum]|uniref:Uncharacterized protein n=1 Tax=Flavobacterium luteum TaxID=2026654 RepID=A0A7J5AGG4_9FLAO|nr:hypothetical protein [Flavobacterium luteum]KAB1156707.1 hypothetical protein F6464_04970 [Flavobacterium luteum]